MAVFGWISVSQSCFLLNFIFTVCLKPAAAHVTQTVSTLCAVPRTVNEAIAETVEQMTCKYLQ